MNFNNKSILITGGTGSFGKRLIETLLNKYPAIREVIVFSRDEHKQFEIRHTYTWAKNAKLKFVLGDVRDEARLCQVFQGVDYVIHAAALKHVHLAEENPIEYIKTNILGAENVINAANFCGVKKVIALSSDKAVAPANLYGATKLCADKLFIAANQSVSPAIFSIVRYGNVMGSRGSVVPFFLEKSKTGFLPITHPEMTRFNMLPGEEVDLVLFALENALGGEIFIPKMPSYRVKDLAEAIDASCEQQTIGVRPGEKLHEDILAESDLPFTIETEKYYIVLPFFANIDSFKQAFKANQITENAIYNSANNTQWLDVPTLKKIIEMYFINNH
jgi:UDP-N-acetylglucosamine 4,6-dehydratase (inverting)